MSLGYHPSFNICRDGRGNEFCHPGLVASSTTNADSCLPWVPNGHPSKWLPVWEQATSLVPWQYRCAPDANRRTNEESMVNCAESVV